MKDGKLSSLRDGISNAVGSQAKQGVGLMKQNTDRNVTFTGASSFDPLAPIKNVMTQSQQDFASSVGGAVAKANDALTVPPFTGKPTLL